MRNLLLLLSRIIRVLIGYEPNCPTDSCWTLPVHASEEAETVVQLPSPGTWTKNPCAIVGEQFLPSGPALTEVTGAFVDSPVCRSVPVGFVEPAAGRAGEPI